MRNNNEIDIKKPLNLSSYLKLNNMRVVMIQASQLNQFKFNLTDRIKKYEDKIIKKKKILDLAPCEFVKKKKAN
jgi:hypothetical protein